jgi:hypothetical protein
MKMKKSLPTSTVTEGLKEKSESPSKKTFNTFTTKESYAWKFLCNTEITAV